MEPDQRSACHLLTPGETEFPEVAAALTDAFADYPVELVWTAEMLEQMHAGGDLLLEASCLARDADGRLLGVGLGALRGDRGRVAAMGVIRDAHRRGVGLALGQAVLQGLEDAGAHTVILEALTVNGPALALYESQLGFRRRRRLIGFTRPPGGPSIDDASWDRALADGGEPDSWQLQQVVDMARTHADLVFVPAVIPEGHAVARMLEAAGFTRAEIDQYELERPLGETHG